MTILDEGFLKNEMGFDPALNPFDQKVAYRRYYNRICEFIASHNYLRPTPSDIEHLLEHGYFEKSGTKFQGRLEDREERRLQFLFAQGEQLVYDYDNGRGNTRQDKESHQFNDSPDMVNCIKSLGLYQRKLLTV